MGNTYFISPPPAGSDNSGDGSQGNPWATHLHAYNLMLAGDVCICRGGTYVLAPTAGTDLPGLLFAARVDPNLSASNPITFTAFSGVSPLLLQSSSDPWH